jgi:hypothetical protein
MEFMITGLEQEGWKLNIDQHTEAKLYGKKDNGLEITIIGYECGQYQGYYSEIAIDWIPRWRW